MIGAGTKNVPFFDYKRAFEPFKDDFVATFKDVLARGAFIMQKDLHDLEGHLADYLGVRHALGVGNATDGMTLAWRAAGLRPGDEVLFPSHTMVATPAAIHFAGGIPRPIDCGPDHLMDSEGIERAITPRTRGLAPVQLNGRTCQMATIEEIAKRHDLLIVEDAAQALGSKYAGRFAGTFGDAGVFSFYPAKVLGCLGDGGFVVTDDDEMARTLSALRDHGRDESGNVVMWGQNSRLDNLQAAFLLRQFQNYDDVVRRRREIAARYQERLGSCRQVTLPPAPDADPIHFDVFQNYEIEAENRDSLRKHLAERGVGTLIQWGGKAVHHFVDLGLDGHLPATDVLFQRCLMLPMNTTLSNDDVDYVADAVLEFYGPSASGGAS